MTQRSVRLTDLPRPFVVGVITESTCAAAAAVMREGSADGTDAHELNLPALAGEDVAHVAGLVRGSAGPVYTTCRRRAFMAVYGIPPDELPDWSDDERMDRQLAMADHGSTAIDIELDTFDPVPKPAAELTWSDRAVRRQRAVAVEAKRMGAEALFSCHAGRPQTAAALQTIARAAIDRGADLVKIVAPCPDAASLLAIRKASIALATSTSVPVTIIGSGAAGLASRGVGGVPGAGWVIGRMRSGSHAFREQPLVADLAAAVTTGRRRGSAAMED